MPHTPFRVANNSCMPLGLCQAIRRSSDQLIPLHTASMDLFSI
jgi:hypothetical protein